LQRNETRASVVGAVRTLLEAGAADGSLRADVDPDDVVSSLLGVLLAANSGAQADRLLCLLVDGLVASR
jgi:hypothetical protein